MTRGKKKIQRNNYQNNFNSDLLPILFGISPIYPRRRKNGNNFTYHPQNSIKKTSSSLLNEKIRQIILWKKFIQRNKSEDLQKLKKNLNYKTPNYSLDEIILQKYPSFDVAIQEFFKFAPVLFLIIYKSSFFFQENKISGSFSILVSKIQSFFFYFVKLKHIFVIKNLFNFEMEFKKKKTNLTIPKKYINMKISGKNKVFKILMDFQIQLAQMVVEKIFFFHEFKFLSPSFYFLKRSFEIWFNNPLRYYKNSRGMVLNQFKLLYKKNIQLKFFLDKKLKKVLKFFKIWNFSKHILFRVSKDNIKGFFFFTEKYFSDFSFKIFLSLLKPLLCQKKNNKELEFYFSSKLAKKYSVVSSFLFLNFVTDYVNLGLILPTLAYLDLFKKKNHSLGIKNFKNKYNSLVRLPNNLKQFFYDSNEFSSKNYFQNILKSKKNRKKKIFPDSKNFFFINICFMDLI